ncbi:transposase [Streptosporangium jomthongense]|uniref:Transposase n=1 Tax=Streptosporangium jomthongense TaxID=1193683 RepID=A0ABV8F213_9ACTN
MLAAILTSGNRGRRHPADATAARVPPVRGKRGRPHRRPDVVLADRGYDHNEYRRQVRGLGIRPLIAHAAPSTASTCANTAGSWSRPSPCCTTSAVCVSAGRCATTSTRHFLSSAAP